MPTSSPNTAQQGDILAPEREIAERRDGYAAAMAAIDCERRGIPVPEKGHEFWHAWYALADAATAKADEELAAFSDEAQDRIQDYMSDYNEAANKVARLEAELRKAKRFLTIWVDTAQRRGDDNVRLREQLAAAGVDIPAQDAPAQSPYRVVAYRVPERPGYLLCLEHGANYWGLIPVTAEELPDGGLCNYGRPRAECGADVLITDGGAKGGAR